MDEDAFWALVESCRSRDPDRVVEKLERRLRRLPIDDITDFGQRLDACLDALYSWDLWAVAYIVNGGCSDDGFEYFRNWVISRGRQSFDLARSDPEGFGLSLRGADEPFELEALTYAVAEAFEHRAGTPGPERAKPAPTLPSGDQWAEEAVEARMPRLAARWFG